MTVHDAYRLWPGWWFFATSFYALKVARTTDTLLYYFMVNCDRLCLQYCLQWIKGS